MYNITEKFIQNNRSYAPLNPIGCVVHSTASKGGTALNQYQYFNEAYRDASAHAFVDWNGIIQTIPFNEKAWHVGATGNQLYIGIELCEPSGYNANQFNAVWKNAVWFFAHVFMNVLGIYQITTENLLAHKEISDRYPNDTDHQDPIAYFKAYGKTVDDFRNAVQICINTGTIEDLTFSGGSNMVLQMGGYNDVQAVITLQENLNTLGYKDSNGNSLITDGDFGGNTDYAVKVFQSEHNLTPDGIVGDMTQQAIRDAIQALSAPVQVPVQTPIDPNAPYKDWNNVSDWAKDAVKTMKDLGIIVGDDTGNFYPTVPITREQLAIVLDRVLKYLGKI